MWDSEQVVSMMVSAGILITALGAVIVNIIVALRTGKKVDENVAAILGVSNQVKEVHTITNSNLSAVKAELKQAVMQIEEMKTYVRSLTGERDKLAAITATALGRSPIDISHNPIPPVTEVKEVLKSIEHNTEETALNTKNIIVDSKEEIARVKKQEKK